MGSEAEAVWSEQEDLKTAELAYILAAWSVHDTIYGDGIQFCAAETRGLCFLTDFHMTDVVDGVLYKSGLLKRKVKSKEMVTHSQEVLF